MQRRLLERASAREDDDDPRHEPRGGRSPNCRANAGGGKGREIPLCDSKRRNRRGTQGSSGDLCPLAEAESLRNRKIFMADEFDVFAQSNVNRAPAPKPIENKPSQPKPSRGNFQGKKPFRKPFRGGNKGGNPPPRIASGEVSVNPLLNAPLPTEPLQQGEAPANSNRNPSLAEYRLGDIQVWPAQTIVDRMMPGAEPEELGTYRKHELIFAAIRMYLANGGAVLASGCLEIVREGHGCLRSAKNNFLSCPEDVFVTQQQIRRHALRTGDIVEGPIRDPRDKDRFFCLGNVNTVNGKEPSVAARVVHFENLTATFPTRRMLLESDPREFTTRVIDLFTPIGFGQRGLIIAPPRVGKTVMLQKLANAISTNYPDAMLIILLIDERPEEVTDMQRNTKAMVLSSTFDEEPQHHVNVTEMVLEMSKRQVENGRDVIILMDSITRMARAYNTVQPHSGKILTGGVDAMAMHRPKRFFGAARNIEGGGSLTIIATGLVDTGSRMDEVIFEEFKGTGNMEMELEKSWGLRRILSAAGPESAMKSVLNSLKKTKSNPEFLLALDLKNV